VQTARELAADDPQLAARGFFGTATAEPWGEYGIDRFPALFNGERPNTYDGVHPIGADTFDVAADVVGLSEEEIADLAAGGALS
jgi:crotonobetainyl-CoA:carnitine CoA-transferase CaiB-like acyl-CoA transferase